jgi:hypothetical protein
VEEKRREGAVEAKRGEGKGREGSRRVEEKGYAMRCDAEKPGKVKAEEGLGSEQWEGEARRAKRGDASGRRQGR